MPQIFAKDPDATLDYIVDWSDWLSTDTISTSTWTVPTGVTKVTDTKTDTSATIWVSGGTAGTNYALANKIVTAAGRTEEKSITLRVRQQ